MWEDDQPADKAPIDSMDGGNFGGHDTIFRLEIWWKSGEIRGRNTIFGEFQGQDAQLEPAAEEGGKWYCDTITALPGVEW